MDGWSNQIPPLQHTSSIYNRKLGVGKNPIRGKIPPHKREEGDKVVPHPKGSVPINEKCSNVEVDP